MIISEDTNNVVQFLDDFSHDSLRKKNDLAALLELAAMSNNFKLMNNLVFLGKSVYNLSQKIRKSSEHNNIIHNELLRCADDLITMLRDIIPDDDSDIAKRFKLTYFNNTSGCLANLFDLAHDLSALKDVQSKRSEILKQAKDELR